MATSDEPLSVECAYQLEGVGTDVPCAGHGCFIAGLDFAAVEAIDGLPIALRWRDIGALEMAPQLIRLRTLSGQLLSLSRLGPRYDDAVEAIIEARITGLAKALYIAEPLCDGTFTCQVAAAPTRIRLYESRLGVFPMAGLPWVVEYAGLTGIAFDATTYEAVLSQGDGRETRISKLGALTDDFVERVTALRGAYNLHVEQMPSVALPGLSEATSSALGGALRAQGCVRKSAVSADVWDALISVCCVGEDGRAYASALEVLSPADQLCLGMAQVTWDGFTGGLQGPATESRGKTAVTAWLLAPLSTGGEARAAVLEAVSEEDHATYGFRVEANRADDDLAEIRRCLRRIQYRREPISDQGQTLIEGENAFAATHLPELAWLRERYLGRALHTAVDAWSKAVQTWAQETPRV